MIYQIEEDKVALVEKAKHLVNRNIENKKFQIAELDAIVERRGYNDIHLGQEREELVRGLNFALIHQLEFDEHYKQSDFLDVSPGDTYGHMFCSIDRTKGVCDFVLIKSQRILGDMK